MKSIDKIRLMQRYSASHLLILNSTTFQRKGIAIKSIAEKSVGAAERHYSTIKQRHDLAILKAFHVRQVN